MNKSILSGIIGCIAGAAIIAVAIWAMKPHQPTEGDDAPTVSAQKPLAPIERASVKPAAVERLTNRTNKGRFIISGRGEDADWGISKEANFQYIADVIADSEILSKDTFSGGEIKVVEKRTFRDVHDSMIVSDVDVRFRLDTLPIKTLSKAIDLAAGIWTAATGDAMTSSGVKITKDLAIRKLEKVDGKGLREILGYAGLQVNDEIEAKVNRLAGRQVTNALGNIRKISGKSYLVSYYQKADSQPLFVSFKNEDGSDITDEEESLVLRRVNAFLDYCLVPNKSCKPGDSWKVQANELQELFDPFVDGDYIGDIVLRRDADNEFGDWIVSAKPCEIRIISSGRKTTGALQLAGGRAEIDPKKITLKTMSVDGRASLTKLTKHHWLFTARLNGECDFEGRMIVDEL